MVYCHHTLVVICVILLVKFVIFVDVIFLVPRLLFNVCFEDEENLLLLSFQDFKMKKFSPRGKENIVTSLGENLGDILRLIVIVESWSFFW
jgi:hypothetical protein